MKRSFLSFISVSVTLWAAAQTSQIATLIHDGELTNFYTASGLQQAYEAAVDGDVITLSSGTFNATDIKKNITIRGAGMGLAEAGDTNVPTLISGSFRIMATSTDTDRLTIEGVEFSGGDIFCSSHKDVSLVKCNINSKIKPSKGDNLTFIQCYLENPVFTNSTTKLTATFTNCVVYNPYIYGLESFLNFFNCVIRSYKDVKYNYNTMTGCIIIAKENQTIEGNNLAHNNIFVGPTTHYHESTNMFVDDISEVFTEDGYYQLTEKALAYPNTDGGQVGIYGGSQPFSYLPSVPRVTRFNVSPKTTADGKLSVDIEVTGAE